MNCTPIVRQYIILKNDWGVFSMPKGEEDLSTEVQLLRAEVAYLKNLHALVSERVRRENGYK